MVNEIVTKYAYELHKIDELAEKIKDIASSTTFRNIVASFETPISISHLMEFINRSIEDILEAKSRIMESEKIDESKEYCNRMVKLLMDDIKIMYDMIRSARNTPQGKLYYYLFKEFADELYGIIGRLSPLLSEDLKRELTRLRERFEGY